MIVRALTPQLEVADPARSQRWYREVLGFEAGFLHESFASVRTPGGELYLSRCATGRAPAPTTCCVRVDDADALHAVCRERGAHIVEPPATRPWGMREFTLVDPDGHRFRIGHATR